MNRVANTPIRSIKVRAKEFNEKSESEHFCVAFDLRVPHIRRKINAASPKYVDSRPL